MAKQTVSVVLGSGADDQATSGKFRVRRVVEGDDGEMLVLSDWKDYTLGVEPTEIEVEVGVVYESQEVEPRGSTRYWVGPVAATAYKDLPDVIPIDPSPGILGDTLVTDLANNPDSDFRRTLADLFAASETGAPTDAQMALIAQADGVFSGVLDDKINAEVPSLVTPAVAAALGPEVLATVEAAVAGLDYVTKPQFTPDGNRLYAFPNSDISTPNGTFTDVIAVDASGYAASTSLSGQTSTVGAAAVAVTSNGSPAFTTSATADSLTITAGTEAGAAHFDAGSPFRTLRCVIATFNKTVTTNANNVGGFVGGTIAANTKMWAWNLSTGGNYQLVKMFGSGSFVQGAYNVRATVGTGPAIAAAVGDEVILKLTSAGVLTLVVNGVVAKTYTLTGTELTATDGTRAGIWGNFASQIKVGLAKFGTVTENVSVDSRKAVTVGPDYKLPTPILAALHERRADIRYFGAKCDGIRIDDAEMTAGSAVLHSSSHPFTTADIGKRVSVIGPGPVTANVNDGVLVGTISSVSSGNATLTQTATSSISGARCVFGTRDDTAVANAQSWLVSQGGGEIYFPAGITIVASSLPVQNYVSWCGEGRELSMVHVLKVGTGTTGSADWLTCSGRTESTPLIGAHFHDFGIDARALAHATTYNSSMKSLNIYHVDRTWIERVAVIDNPATAIPFDHSYNDCAIVNNLVINPGRLAPSGLGPGGSGIGVGTKGVGATDPTVIRDNSIYGTQSSSLAGPGHNGIFVEAQTGADALLGTYGYRIVNNLVKGMPHGISDTGSTGTIIEGNDIIGCGNGVRISPTSLSASYPGTFTKVRGNTIQGSTGPGATDGNGISIYSYAEGSSGGIAGLHSEIEGNTILDSKSRGILVNLASAGPLSTIDGLMMRGNKIGRSGRSGIRLFAAAGKSLRSAHIHGNQIFENGKAGVAGDIAAVTISSGSTLLGGRIQDNDFFDYAATPTQLNQIVATGATLTDVKVKDNTSDVLVPA